MRLNPQETYLFDGMSVEESDELLNSLTFYNELPINIQLKSFLKEKQLSRVFIPVATFHEERKEQTEEFVAIMEGESFPFFGVAYSIEKVQFNFDFSIEDDIDHTKPAVGLAMRFANMFVDEARLNGNFFNSRETEAKSLI